MDVKKKKRRKAGKDRQTTGKDRQEKGEIMAEMIILGIFTILSFTLGLFLGQKLNNNEEVNPVKAVSEMIETHETKKEIKQENDRLDTILENIENYDGSGLGQKNIR